MSNKILVVDDNQINLDLVSRILQMEKYEVFTACSGATALKKVVGLDPDMIILDLMMPEMNGCELCRNLRMLPNCARIPIIMLSASSDQSDRLQAENAGVNALLTKPFELEGLQTLIKKLLSKESSAGQ